jgi:NADH-quinone oxidoreductase subunit N
MLGYSSIAHAGYIMLGLVTLGPAGHAAALFYILGFVAMSLGAFLVICQVSRDGANVLVDDLSGLHSRSPLAAGILAACMFGMAGIPPFVGFMGKFFLLAEALQRGLVGLVIVAAINTAIGIYYYLSVVKVLYFNEPGDRPAIKLEGLSAVLGLALLAIILVLGIIPQPVYGATLEAVKALVR